MCTQCRGQMRLIAFITSGDDLRKILGHVGEEATAPKISPARGSPLRDEAMHPVMMLWRWLGWSTLVAKD
jgi:hypothetical protein